jgi:hypothetical protein
VTYTVGHEPALATGANTFAPAFLAASATVEFSTPAVTLGGIPRTREADFVVSITRPASPAAKLFGGFITLTPNDGGPALRVPYGGYNGDYQEIVALTPTPAGLPWLAKLVLPSLINQPNGAVFTLVGDDLPFILLHLDHHVRELEFRSRRGLPWAQQHRDLRFRVRMGRNDDQTSGWKSQIGAERHLSNRAVDIEGRRKSEESRAHRAVDVAAHHHREALMVDTCA